MTLIYPGIYLVYVNSFINEGNFNEIPYMIRFGIDKWTKSMLSITSCQQCSIVHLMISIVKSVSLKCMLSINKIRDDYG